MPVKSQRIRAAELPGPPFCSSHDLKGVIQSARRSKSYASTRILPENRFTLFGMRFKARDTAASKRPEP
ncbi:hypothetical protein D584_07923 [Brucella intermedia M86]|uniref:Uncharacterized protein n=2 Tax=Brucella intermedia TaxID=94625 RepID=U4VBX1_9HYPH|nr:hypothetical protein D584_07923 [Brucella intermedia M86]ERM02528.1 hypothetical protein Q644_16070 [Brucella intermedia 229E]